MTSAPEQHPLPSRLPAVARAFLRVFRRAPAAILLLAATVSCTGKGGDSAPAPAPSPASSEASADAPWGPGHARAHLIADRPAAAPGESLLVGVSFDIQPGWHLYWNGTNDTGYPIQVRPELPAGWSAGRLLWPAPERHVSPGNILDHVYTGRVTLLLPLRAGPAEADSVILKARLEWLACREVCLPGSAEVALTLPVRTGARTSMRGGEPPRAGNPAPADPDARARFEETRERLPLPLSASPTPVEARREDGAVVVVVPGAERLVFFPGVDCARLADPIRDAAADGDRLRLVPAPEAGASPAVNGVLEVRRPGAGPAFYTLSLPPPAGS